MHDGAGIAVAVPELVSMPWAALRSAVAVVVVAVDAAVAVVAVEVVAAAVVGVVAVATWVAVFHTWSR